MGNVRETFCIYHVTAPGQQPSAEDLPEGFVYPTMDELSEQVSPLDCNLYIHFFSNFCQFCFEKLSSNQSGLPIHFSIQGGDHVLVNKGLVRNIGPTL